jgi:hypothetical protein
VSFHWPFRETLQFLYRVYLSPVDKAVPGKDVLFLSL